MTVRPTGKTIKKLASRLRSEGPVAMVLALAGWVAWPLFRETPLSHDHPVHVFQAWHFWSEMLGRGRLRGWSHYWAFGYPSGELTPFGADLWVALFRGLSLGQLSWTRTYALSLVALLAFTAWAMFRFARRYFGATVAVMAALGWLFDPGASFEGGWDWCMNWGVWPVTLGMSFVMLALASLDAVLSEPRHRNVLVTALWMALSLITHQLSLAVYAVAVPWLLADHWMRSGGLRPGSALRVFAAMSLGAACSAFYFIPVLARTELTLDLGEPGISLEQLGKNLVDMRVFANMWPPIFLLGLAGAVITLKTRRPAGLFFTASAGLLVLFSSNILVDVLHLERLVKGILKLEAHRMLLAAKLFWFPLAASAAVALFGRPVRVLGVPWPRWRRLVWWLVPAVLVVPMLSPACQRLYDAQIAKRFPPESSLRYWSDLTALFAWSAREREGNPDFYRIAYDLPIHDHLSTLAPVFDRTLYYKVGYTPSQQFQRFPVTRDPEFLQALSVKYLVSDRAEPETDFVLEREFGKLRLYRYRRYRSEPFTLSGAGRAELVRFEPERIELRLSSTAPGSQIKLHVANHDRWQATLAGTPVAIAPAPVYDREDPILMEIPAADGALVVRYVRRWPDWMGLVVSLLALPVYGLLVWLGARKARCPGWLGAAGERLREWMPKLRIAAWAGALLGVLAAVWRVVSPSSLLPDDSIFRELASGSLSLAGQRCHPSDPLRWQCGPHVVRVAVVRGEGFGLPICVTAPPVGDLVLTLDAELGRFLEGHCRAGSGSGRFGVAVNDQLFAEASTRPSTREDRAMQAILFDTRSYAGKASSRLRLEVSGAALHCFDVRKIR